MGLSVSGTVATKRRTAAPPEKQREILRLVERLGVRGASRLLGVGRDSTRRLASGEAVLTATLLLALVRLETSP